MTSYHAHIGYTPDDDMLAHLRGQLAPDVRLTVGDDVPPDTHALVAGRPTTEQLAASDTLRLLLIPFAGLPAVTRGRLADFPHIAVHNLHHNAAATTELAIGLLLAGARGIIPAHNTFRHGDWTTRYTGGTVLLNGKTALILGYGEIGRRVGAVCRALGMRVLGVRRSPSDEPDVFTLDALPELLPRADVLFITLPGTPETDGIISAAELDALPDGAILVNTGRAVNVDAAALYDALVRGKLHSAALDVWYTYPDDEAARTQTYPADYPFWELANVVLSPHRGGAFGNPEIEQARMDGVAAALNAAARGEPIPHPVDLTRGY